MTKNLLTELKTSLLAILTTGVILCGVYPLVVWAVGSAAFPFQAGGSLIRGTDGALLGSALLGQGFSDIRYFHSRPSAAGAGYDATASSGSNLGPTSQALIDQVKQRVDRYRTVNGLAPDALVPADAVTASASGLDRHISPRNAALQIPRIATARNLPEAEIVALVRQYTEGPDIGFLGDPGVNVLKLNLALDGRLKP